MVKGSRGKTRNSTRFPASCAPSRGLDKRPDAEPNSCLSLWHWKKKPQNRFHQITSRECCLQSRPCQGIRSSINSSISSAQPNYRFPALDSQTYLENIFSPLWIEVATLIKVFSLPADKPQEQQERVVFFIFVFVSFFLQLRCKLICYFSRFLMEI